MKVKGLLVAAIAAMMCMGAQNASAIEAPNHEGDINFNAHIGFAPGVGGNLSLDYVLVNSWWEGHFTIGGFGGFNTHKNSYSSSKDEYDQIYTNISIMARSTYGLNITDNFEVHAGAMTGPCFHSWKYDVKKGSHPNNDDSEVKLNTVVIAGCRFFMSDGVALSSEMIWGGYQSYFNFGLSFKF
jgi:hypothetical protein